MYDQSSVRLELSQKRGDSRLVWMTSKTEDRDAVRAQNDALVAKLSGTTCNSQSHVKRAYRMRRRTKFDMGYKARSLSEKMSKQ